MAQATTAQVRLACYTCTTPLLAEQCGLLLALDGCVAAGAAMLVMLRSGALPDCAQRSHAFLTEDIEPSSASS